MNSHKKFQNLLVPFLSVLLGLVFGAIIIALIGKDPIEAYQYLFGGALGTSYGIGQTLRSMAPLILTALGFSVAYKAGFFNIGLSGQALAGWLTSVWVALSFPTLPQYMLLPLCIVTGMIAGAVWAGIAGILKAYFNASEVITTIMLNYVILYVNDFLIRNVMTNPAADKTNTIPQAASLRWDVLTELTDNSTVHLGIIISVFMALLVHIMLKRTTLGLELRAVGLNPFAAEYAGMNAKKNIIRAMFISGCLAGLAGVMEGLGQFENIFLQNGVSPAIGFTGMSVSLLALGNPLGIILSAALFGIFESGSSEMSLMTNVPAELVTVITAIIIFFVGANYIIRFILDKIKWKQSEEA
ncbi:ABC transporter permease [Granulicatella sp. zg-ZJ]|uniref:ABC transporter permease n=1 Tax=unclassified Granulicatella TaxID=2630493 RepID=UPI0013BF4F84|nr:MULTISPECIES: ABC transporter permease [unclassified Granulicatella]NEW62687.1 ABC transporter permease [Granulicatella sp. zg-ZJ]NEW65744.1 ABC transporter permease [Granulicatella sp. zg-84]QMI86503.1 ABC transporter permease [Carnobacteriaceae bacterium zg-84]